MVQTGSNPVRLFTTAGLSSILSPATLESLVTNADGTTSLQNDEDPGSSPGGPPKKMGTIAQWIEHGFHRFCRHY